MAGQGYLLSPLRGQFVTRRWLDADGDSGAGGRCADPGRQSSLFLQGVQAQVRQPVLSNHPSDLKVSPELEASSARVGGQGTLYLAQQALREVAYGR